MTAGTITLALRTAQSGLLANQSALDAVANNISNVNSPGYSRKIVNMEQRVLSGTGSGVQIAGYTRKIDEGLLKSLRQELSTFQQHDIKTDYFDRLSDLFGEPGQNNSISHLINQFTQSLESLSLNPDKPLEQSEVVRWGTDIGLTLRDMTETIQDLRLQADNEINEAVTRINTLVTQIGDYNDKIVRETAVKNDATSLEDQRDAALNELSQLIDIAYYSRSDGDIVVFTKGGRTLVDNIPTVLTHNGASSAVATTTHAEGDFSAIYAGAALSTNDITNEIRDGRLKGLIELRDGTLPNLQSELDEMAGEMRDQFNLIHNRGMAYPGSQSLLGTRKFIQPGTSTMTFNGNDDTTIVLLNASGEQQATTTVRTLLGGASGTVNATASAIQTWMQANGPSTATMAVDSTTNTMKLELNSTSYSIAFRDQSATANGSTHQDATIKYDFDGAGTADGDGTSYSGFANFMGLNDFFSDSLNDSQWQSKSVSSGFTVQAGTLTFTDGTGALTGSPLTIAAGKTLEEVASTITSSITNVTASVVPDGAGYRLRIAHNNGSNLYISQTTGQTFLSNLGMEVSDSGVAASFGVRSDIADTPGLISRGAVQWNADKGVAGEYYVSNGDETIVQALAAKFTGTNAFDKAGGMENLTISFSDYAAAIVGRNATEAGQNEDALEYQQTLTESMQAKSDRISGVNMDEEMSQLILYEQAYSAAARVITIIQSMFDALEQAVR